MNYMCIEKLYKPKTKFELRQVIKRCFEERYTNLNNIDTSLITNMSCLFVPWSNQYFKISEWDVRNVKTMENMFNGCRFFNSDISKWNTKNVEDMSGMFYGCSSFNQDLSKWNLRNLEWNGLLFYRCPIKEEWKPKYYELSYGRNKIQA